jgi:arylsulfatase A-like enzyme
VLKTVGYTTALVGKWHLGLGSADEPLDWNREIKPGPPQLGFDYSFHMAATGDRVPTVYIENGYIVGLDPADPITVSYQQQVGDDPTGLSHPHLLLNQADEQHAKTIVDGTSRIGWMSGGEVARWTDEEMPDVFLGKAIDFITENKDGPFFMFYAVHENHVPRIPHPRFRGSTSLGVRGDAVVQMDWGIGRIMETLEELGLTEDTLIIFSSDNGPVLFDGYYDGAWEMNGDHEPAGPWHGGKYSVWEGGTRMPTILSWPGTVKPGRSDAIVSQVDFLASLAALTGAKIPEGRAGDSQNQIKALLGQSDVGREHVVQQGVNAKAIRRGDWKYIPPGTVRDRFRIGTNTFEKIPETGGLYFLPEDPEERHNVAADSPHITAEMAALLEAQLE